MKNESVQTSCIIFLKISSIYAWIIGELCFLYARKLLY